MENLISAYIFPHPPIIVPEVGRGEERPALKTIEACRKASMDIASKKPETIVVITPHGPVFRDAVSISVKENLSGSFKNFRRPDVKLNFKNDAELVEKILINSKRIGIEIAELDDKLASRFDIDTELDHGTLVPLYYVAKEYSDFKLVHISMGFISLEELFAFGTAIRDAVIESGRNTAIIASGDLSHSLTKDAPCGYNKRGKEYDELLVGLLREGRFNEIISVDEKLINEAGECGLRPFTIMFGALKNYNVHPKVLSYEGPFGVGYCIAILDIVGRKAMSESEKLNSVEEDSYVKLAKQSLESYVRTGKVMDVPKQLPEEMLTNRAGVFVSLKIDGDLRGCIGTIMPTTGSIAEEIIQNAVSAGTQDPRFFPVQVDELSKITYSVDLLGAAEPINSKLELDVKKYGVIVRAGRRSGLLLPDLEGVNTVDEQVDIALRKAGIRPDEPYKMERFEVIRHGRK